jgi:hypothetical protein
MPENVLDNAFFITVMFIGLSTFVGMIIKKLHRDKCLKDFAGYMVTLEGNDGKDVWGKLRVENTGIELAYPEKQTDTDGHLEASYIVYKFEFPNIAAFVRYHDGLSEKSKKKRLRDLDRTYHPGLIRRARRKTQNFFKTIRDAMVEIMNLLISKAKKTGPAAGTLASQDKYVTQMKKELIGSVGTSYEPLLERYIGHKVVLEVIKGDRILECAGVLKDYTAELIEVMDVDYKKTEDAPIRKADLVVLRKLGIVRHLAE